VNSSERGDGQVLPYSISAFWVSGAPLFDQRSHLDATREFLAANPANQDPPSLFGHQRAAVKAMAERHLSMFGSAGKAW
jgi:hypothetical protein